MRDLLFSVPWWIPTVLVIAGVALLVSGNRRQNVRVRTSGFALIALAVAWSVISYLVDTPREIAQKQTRQFVQSVVDRNWNTFDALMAPDADFTFAGSSWRLAPRQAIDDAVRPDVNQIGLHGAHVSDMKATESGDAVVIHATVWSEQDFSMGRPLDSEWEFEWRPNGGRWLLHEIRAIRVANVSPEEVRGSLRKR